MSFKQWMDKQNMVNTQWNIIQPKKGNKLSHMATKWMNPEYIMLSEINQSQKDKQCMIPLI